MHLSTNHLWNIYDIDLVHLFSYLYLPDGLFLIHMWNVLWCGLWWVCTWIRGTRGTSIHLFPLCPCLCLPFRVYLALSVIEEKKHFTGSIMCVLCWCILHSWLMGFHCVECLPGVTAEQKHLSVVHKDLQKNEDGLGMDDWIWTLQRADYLHNKVLQRGVQAISH